VGGWGLKPNTLIRLRYLGDDMVLTTTGQKVDGLFNHFSLKDVL